MGSAPREKLCLMSAAGLPSSELLGRRVTPAG